MINQPLFDNQFNQVLGFLFNGRKATILRWIRQCGRSKVTWIYFSIGSSLRASFISFKDLTRAYLQWLGAIDILSLKLEERKAIGRANWILTNVGDAVFHLSRKNNAMGIVTEKVVHNYLPVLMIDWGKGFVVPEHPWLLEKF
ncbi:MAG: hypothetical protein QNJ34_13905 [Xenococcaceae cyanobacterium MO_188.B29]|nr:hypothetical protein [Xenococcaceae cyanobacterium MO_188.B29]